MDFFLFGQCCHRQFTVFLLRFISNSDIFKKTKNKPLEQFDFIGFCSFTHQTKSEKWFPSCPVRPRPATGAFFPPFFWYIFIHTSRRVLFLFVSEPIIIHPVCCLRCVGVTVGETQDRCSAVGGSWLTGSKGNDEEAELGCALLPLSPTHTHTSRHCDTVTACFVWRMMSVASTRSWSSVRRLYF